MHQAPAQCRCQAPAHYSYRVSASCLVGGRGVRLFGRWVAAKRCCALWAARAAPRGCPRGATRLPAGATRLPAWAGGSTPPRRVPAASAACHLSWLPGLSPGGQSPPPAQLAPPTVPPGRQFAPPSRLQQGGWGWDGGVVGWEDERGGWGGGSMATSAGGGDLTATPPPRAEPHGRRGQAQVGGGGGAPQD